MLLAAVFIVAAALRLHHLGTASFWLDELLTTQFTTAKPYDDAALQMGQVFERPTDLTNLQDSKPWWAVWSYLKFDAHPPLHILLLRGWRALVGESDAGLRLSSVLFSLVGLYFLFDAVRVAHGPGPGLVAAGIYALAGPQIEFAQETRSYAMLVAVCAAAMSITVRIDLFGLNRSRAGLLGLILLIGMLTHYYAAWTFVACVAYLFWRKRGRERQLVALTCAIAAGVYLASWGPMIWAQRANFSRNMEWIAYHEPDHLVREVRLLLGLPLRFLFTPSSRWMDENLAGAWPTLLPGLLFLLPLPWVRKDPRIALWTACLYTGVGAVLVADLVQERQTLQLIRYVLPASLAAYAVIAGVSALSRGLLRYALPGVAIGGCALTLGYAWERTRPDWRSFVRSVAATVQPGDIIVIWRDPARRHHGYIQWIALSHYTEPMPAPMLLLESPPDGPTLERLRQARRLHIISDTTGEPLEKLFPGVRVRDPARDVVQYPWAGICQSIDAEQLRGFASSEPQTSSGARQPEPAATSPARGRE
jgi:hypothetical protein